MQTTGGKLCREIEASMDAPAPDRQELWFKLRRLEQVANPPKDDMEPPFDQFEQTVLELRDVLASRPNDPNVQAHADRVENLDRAARNAHAQKDRRTWAQVNGALQMLLYRLVRPPSDTPRQRPAPSTPSLKMSLKNALDQTRQLLTAKQGELLRAGKLERLQRRVSEISSAIDQVEAETDQIDDSTEPSLAQSQVRMLYSQKVQPLEKQIETLGYDVE
jgi:hypothetical protein